MKYFIIRQSSEPKIVGIKNGSSQARIDRDGFANKATYDSFIGYFLNKDHYTYWRNVGTFPNFEMDLECVRLDKNAKLTDFLSYYPNLHHGGKFLISERALEILISYNLPPHAIYNAKIYSNGHVLSNYKLLYCPPLPYEVISFEKSIFFFGNELLGKKFFNIKSPGDFERLKEDQLFEAERISFSNNFDTKLDYFLTKVSIPNIFISDRLRTVLQKEEITGINIIEANEPVIELE